MKKHMMKDPCDLDAFAADQIEITRSIDQKNKGADRWATHCHLMFTLAMQHIRGLGIPCIQRGAYEAHALAEREPSATNKARAEVLWFAARIMQEDYEIALRLAKGEIGDLLAERMPEEMKEIRETIRRLEEE